MSGIKYDDLKPRMQLLPSAGLIGAAYGMTLGAMKYSSYNWCGGIAYSRLLGALKRHIELFSLGEDIDPIESGGSGLPHVFHICDCALMLADMIVLHPELDDRFKFPPEALTRLRTMMERAQDVLQNKLQHSEQESFTTDPQHSAGKIDPYETPLARVPSVVSDSPASVQRQLSSNGRAIGAATTTDSSYFESKFAQEAHKDICNCLGSANTTLKDLEWEAGTFKARFANLDTYEKLLTQIEAEEVASCFPGVPYHALGLEQWKTAPEVVPVPQGSTQSFVVKK